MSSKRMPYMALDPRGTNLCDDAFYFKYTDQNNWGIGNIIIDPFCSKEFVKTLLLNKKDLTFKDDFDRGLRLAYSLKTSFRYLKDANYLYSNRDKLVIESNLDCREGVLIFTTKKSTINNEEINFINHEEYDFNLMTTETLYEAFETHIKQFNSFKINADKYNSKRDPKNSEKMVFMVNNIINLYLTNFMIENKIPIIFSKKNGGKYVYYSQGETYSVFNAPLRRIVDFFNIKNLSFFLSQLSEDKSCGIIGEKELQKILKLREK